MPACPFPIRSGFAKLNLAAIAAAGIFSFVFPEGAPAGAALGRLYLSILKMLAPFIVFFSVADALAQGSAQIARSLARLLGIYLLGMVLAGAAAMGLSMLSPAPLSASMLAGAGAAREAPSAEAAPDCAYPEASAADAVWDAAASALFETADEMERQTPLPGSGASLLWVLLAAALTGILLSALQKRHGPLRRAAHWLNVCASTFSGAVRIVLRLLPLCLFGLFYGMLPSLSRESLAGVGHLAAVLCFSCCIAEFLVLPLLFWRISGASPWPPLAFVLKESALPALLSRSSIANLPLNLAAAERLGLPQTLAQAALPIAAIFNMPGAVVTLVGLSMSAAATFGLEWNVSSLSLLLASATVAALAASGLPNGAVFMLPITLGLAGAGPAEESAFIAAYFLVSIVQDAFGTALNSSADLYLLWAEALRAKKEGHFELSNARRREGA